MTDPSSRRIRVVVVDDSSAIRAALANLLKMVPQTELVGEAADGVEGVDVVLRTRPDVVVMDMQMPNLDGIGAARRIIEQWPVAQILMNSAYTDESLQAEAEEVGVRGYMSKDLRPAKLVRAIIALGHLTKHDESPTLWRGS